MLRDAAVTESTIMQQDQLKKIVKVTAERKKIEFFPYFANTYSNKVQIYDSYDHTIACMRKFVTAIS